ncbi:MAG TPA: hypothetical protein V6C57_07150 [Coleofasciculaceae cyanobacterium]
MLAHPIHEPSDAMPWHDRVQIALAIADPLLLKSLLTDCLPSIAPPHQIGSISTKIGIPIESRRAIDGIIQFEAVRCVMADSLEDAEQGVFEYAHRQGHPRGYLDLTHCEAEVSTLGQSLSLAQAIGLLAQSGFSPQQVDAILHLPQDAWYKSWWFTLGAEGGFTVPFLRSIRTRRYANGTFTIQYKDFFDQDKPPCFQSQDERVLVEISTEPKNFRKILEKINYARQQFGIERALLICDRLSELETQGFISQGISLYTADEMALPARARCVDCVTEGCPMNGRADSPVVLCQRFCLETQPV